MPPSLEGKERNRGYMADYQKMNRVMQQLGFPASLIQRVNADFTQARCGDKKTHAAFLRHACDVLDEALQAQEISFVLYRDLMDANGCCKCGKREKDTRALGKAMAGQPLCEKIAALARVPNMIAPRLAQDGTLLLEMHCSDGKGFYCSCGNIRIPQTEKRLSKHYCMCCAGHFRFHYQHALGERLELVEVVSSPLASLGAEPFIARFRIL